MQSFKSKFLGVTILQGVKFPIFLLIFEWALQQCSANALPVISYLASFTRYNLRNVLNRYIWLPLLHLTPTEGFSWDDLRKIFTEKSEMAKVPNGVETLPKISIA